MPYINLLIYLEKFQSMEHFKQELVEYLDYYNNRRIRAKRRACACNSQTTSPFGYLNNFYFKYGPDFLGSPQNRGCPAIYLVKKPCS